MPIMQRYRERMATDTQAASHPTRLKLRPYQSRERVGQIATESSRNDA